MSRIESAKEIIDLAMSLANENVKEAFLLCELAAQLLERGIVD